MTQIESPIARVFGLHIRRPSEMSESDQKISNFLLILGYIPVIGLIVACIRVNAMQQGSYETSLKGAIYVRAGLEALGIGILLFLADAIITVYRLFQRSEILIPETQITEESLEIDSIPPSSEMTSRKLERRRAFNTIKNLTPLLFSQDEELLLMYPNYKVCC